MKIRIHKSLIKRFISRTVLKVLGNAVEAIDHVDKHAHHDLSEYKEGCIIGLKAFPEGQTMYLVRKNGYFVYSGMKSDFHPDYLITFKSLDDAVPVLTGMKGIEQAYIEHRFTLEGDLMTSLPLVRALGTVEAYLFPSFMLRHLFIKVPSTDKPKIKGRIQTFNTLIKNGRVA